MTLRATLSLDLDDSWTYMRAAGRGDWQETPSVIPVVCERLVEFCRELDQRLSMFVVGRDLLDPDKAAAVQSVATAGQEIACHTFDHRPDFALLSPEDLRYEIEHGAELVEQCVGRRPIGFRAPGYARHQEAAQVLRDAGFRYDGSSLPTFLGPACRAYYFFKSGMSREERRRRTAMYGRLRDALASNRARVRDSLVTVPVTTFPLLRTPFHMSYVIWLAKRSRRAALAYLGTGLATCRLFRVEPSYLLHSLDFIGHGEHPHLDFFPGMDVTWEAKRELLLDVVRRLQKSFRVVAMDTFADEILGASPVGPAPMARS